MHETKDVYPAYLAVNEIHAWCLKLVKGVLAMSNLRPLVMQEAACLVILQALYKNRTRVLWEMPAGHGKSYLMLFLAGLLLK